jgi:integrase
MPTKTVKIKSTKKTWNKIAGLSNFYRYKNANYYFRGKVKGKIRSICLETQDKDIAKRKLLEVQRQIKSSIGEITFIELLDLYRKSRGGRNEKTIMDVYRRLKKHHATARMLVRKIKPVHITEYFASIDLNPRMHNLNVETLKGALQYGVDNDYLLTNPFLKLHRFRKKTKRIVPVIPTLEEFEIIMLHILSNSYSDTAEKAYDLGMFIGLAALGEAEARNLKWQDINWEKQRIKIKRIKTDTDFEIPVYKWLKPHLLDLFQRSGQPKVGQVFKLKTIKRSLKSACEALGFDLYTPRNLRQMGIVRQLDVGLKPKIVAKYQGHQDGGILIMNTYSEVINRDEDKNLNSILLNLGVVD